MIREEDYEEEWDFVQSHKKIPVNLIVVEPCTDTISRQAVLAAMRKNHRSGGRDIDGDYIEGDYRKSLYDDIISLPPVTPAEKVGHWILQPSNKEQGERDFIWWKCSECGQVIYSETEKDRREYHAYCGKCGAKMEVVEE